MPTLRMSASKGPHSRPEAGLRRGIFQSPGRTRTGMDADVKRKQLAAALNRAAQGDRAALRLIYDMTSAKLFGVCLRILNDRSEAEDVLQEVYLTVWNKGSAFDEARASPITWLVAIARNRAIDRARSGAFARRSEPIEAAADVADPGVSAFEFLASAQQQERLKSCLDEIEERQSLAIKAAFMGGFTYDELAERSGVPLGTMKSWIRRGLAKLRECLER
jgi:RNA polymerase sigma factor (sigma-70 family)